MSDEVEELPEIDEAVDGASSDTGSKSKESAGLDEANDVSATLPDLGLIMDVPLRLSVELGSAQLRVRDVLALSKGSVVELDRVNGEPADIYVNDRLIARGQLTTEDERVAIRITELIAVHAAANVA